MTVAGNTLDQTLRAPAPAPTPAPRRPFLLVLTGPRAGELHRLTPGADLVIGRDQRANIRIDDDGVSRRHATIRAAITNALLLDLGSHNGTFVRGKRIQEQLLRDGDRIQIGIASTLKLTLADDLEADYQRKLAEAALRDPLTGLPNRRDFHGRLSTTLASSRRHGRPLSVLAVDVDRFKTVNDEHGHLGGDEVLRLVARVLQASLRKEDVVARVGGDEFLILAETDAIGAATLGEALRRAVELARCHLGTAEVAVSVSVGTATRVPAELDLGAGARDLLEAADQALYEAKQQGRNGVVAG